MMKALDLVVGEVRLPTPIKSEIGKRLLESVVVGTYLMGL